MLKLYIHENQLYNFLILKEPVRLINNAISEAYIEVNISHKDLIITTYNTYTTVELKTLRKVVKRWMKHN